MKKENRWKIATLFVSIVALFFSILSIYFQFFWAEHQITITVGAYDISGRDYRINNNLSDTVRISAEMVFINSGNQPTAIKFSGFHIHNSLSLFLFTRDDNHILTTKQRKQFVIGAGEIVRHKIVTQLAISDLPEANPRDTLRMPIFIDFLYVNERSFFTKAMLQVGILGYNKKYSFNDWYIQVYPTTITNLFTISGPIPSQKEHGYTGWGL